MKNKTVIINDNEILRIENALFLHINTIEKSKMPKTQKRAIIEELDAIIDKLDYALND